MEPPPEIAKLHSPPENRSRNACDNERGSSPAYPSRASSPRSTAYAPPRDPPDPSWSSHSERDPLPCPPRTPEETPVPWPHASSSESPLPQPNTDRHRSPAQHDPETHPAPRRVPPHPAPHLPAPSGSR